MRAKISFIVTLVLISFSTAIAQSPSGQGQRRNPEEMATRQTERMTTDLKLNDKQKTEVAAINLKYAKLRSELFQANQGDREAARAKMQVMDTQKNDELKKALTADQFKLYEEQEKKRQEERRQRGDQHQGPDSTGKGQRGQQRGGGEK